MGIRLGDRTDVRLPEVPGLVAAGNWDGASTDAASSPISARSPPATTATSSYSAPAATVVRDGLDPDVLVWAP